MKRTGRRGRVILVIGVIAVLAAAAWLIAETMDIFSFLFDAPPKPARFVERCAPDWEAAYEALAAAGGKARRGERMPEPVQKIFSKDRTLESIRIIGDGSARFEFDWITGPEMSSYIYWQKNDDYWQIQAVTGLLSWYEKYSDQIVADEKENSLKLTGFGAGKGGYILVTRLRPCWFVTEEYYPT